MKKIIVVVPDGIVKKGTAVIPSFVYKSALDAANSYKENRPIFLATANKCNTEFYEQEGGERYLLSIGCQKNIYFPKLKKNKYIDTWGNATVLMEYLLAKFGPEILNTEVVLVSG